MTSANKVMANTAILYIRMAITIGISFYSTRLILASVGAVDFGIFSLLMSVTVMMTFLNSAMSISTQHFFSFYQGTHDLSKQTQVFANSLLLHLAIGILVVSGLSILEPILLNDLLSLPVGRIDAAISIYHYLLISIFFSVISVPFMALLNAHEEMFWRAVVNAVEVILKLGVALILLSVTGDKLVIYGALLACISVFSFLLYVVYCFQRYPECTVNPKNISTPLLKEIASFIGWNSFGTFCLLSRTQGLAVVFNMFFGPVVNTSYGISNQVSNQLLFFSNTMLKALNPQIVKSEGAGNRDRMLRIALMGSKYAFFLFALFSIPFLFEARAIISFWLKIVPENAVLFCQFVIVASLLKQLTLGLPSAILATGHVRFYQLVIGTLWLLNLPAAYLFFSLGFGLSSVMLFYVCIEFLTCIARIWIAKKVLSLSIDTFVSKVLLKAIIPTLICTLSCFMIVSLLDFPGRFLVTSVISGCIFIVTVYFIGTEPDERLIMKQAFFGLRQNYLNFLFAKKK